MAEPVWVERLVLDAVHLDQLREHGGLPGVRDENALESALARARQKWHHAPESDLATLAAGYAFGIVTSHPYRDGNKRSGFLAMAIFLGLNGCEIETTEPDVVTTILAVAENKCSEETLAAWVRNHLIVLR